jgi:hypothetical protein
MSDEYPPEWVNIGEKQPQVADERTIHIYEIDRLLGKLWIRGYISSEKKNKILKLLEGKILKTTKRIHSIFQGIASISTAIDGRNDTRGRKCAREALHLPPQR